MLNLPFFGRKSPYPVDVSVLTPVYNVEKYLPQCLDSLKAQTLQHIEFIVINDGSTDGSLDVMREYAAGDPRFVIVNQENGGYGKAMNAGLARARGEYVGIVESDDFASPEMFKTLFAYAKRRDCDIVKSNYFTYDGEDHYEEPFIGQPYRQPFDVRDHLDVVKVLPIIWAAIYRRSMLQDNGIQFNETPGASFQDTSFVQRAWFASHRVALLRRAYLHYRVNRDESSVKSDKKVFEVCGEYALSNKFLHDDPEKLASFGRVFQVMRLDTYRWNYNRIALACHAEFAEKWAEEVRAADAEDLNDEGYFSPRDWALIHELMDDPAAFAEKYTELEL